MAHITNPTRGVWIAQAFLGRDANGKAIRKTRTFHGKEREARRAIDAWERSLAAGPASDTGLASTTPLVEVMDRVADAHRPKWSDNHTYGYELSRQRIAEHPIGRRPIEAITKAEIIDYLIDVGKARNPRTGRQMAATAKNRRKHLSLTFAFALDADMITVNPMPKASKIPLAPEARIEDRDLPTAIAVLNAVEAVPGLTPAQWLLVNLALTTGLRRGELVGLRFADFEPQPDGTAVLRVRRQVKPIASEARRVELGRTSDITPTKTRQARSLWVDATTTAMVLDAQIALDVERLTLGLGPAEPTAWVFSEDWVDPLYPTLPTAWWADIRKAAGLPTDLRLHDLRHIHATALIGAGIDVRTVAARLGHDPNVTLSTYAHALPGTDRDAGDAAGDMRNP